MATVAVVVLVAGAVVIGARASHGVPARVTRAGLPMNASSPTDTRYFKEIAASMEPTIDAGDRVAANTRYAPLRTGDVIVFKPPSVDLGAAGATVMIKRVIGLPGETIASSGDTVLINGRPLAEPYLRSGQSLGPAIGPEVIPAGQYFVLGDNRTNSADSRYFGPIEGTSVIGVVTAIVAPPSRVGPISGPTSASSSTPG